MGSPYDVAVLGAGPAGLAAAWRAALAGHRVVVLERAERVGGMAASFEVAGQRVDLGSHRLHPAADPAILDALRDLLGDDLQTRPRNGRIRLLDRWVGFPLRTTDLLRHLPPRFSVGAGVDAMTSPFRRATHDDFSSVVRAGLGPTVARTFYDPYARKLWGTDPSELSGDLARRRVSARSPLAILRRLARGTRPSGRVFLYPRLGYGEISERLATSAVQAGAELRLGETAFRIDLPESNPRATVTLASGDQLEARRVWSTMPLTRLAQLVQPAPPAGVLDAAAALQHRAMVLVYLVLDTARYTPYDAHYFPSERTVLSRLSEPKNYRDNPEDPFDRTVLCAEVPCWSGDALWRAAPDRLGQLVAETLEHEGLPAVPLVRTEVVRLPNVYPVFASGYDEPLRQVTAWASGEDRLLSFGRQGLFVPDNTHHALAMGWAAADSLRTDGSFDDARWEAATVSFAGNVVED